MKTPFFRRSLLRLFVIFALFVVPGVGPAPAAAQDGPDTPAEQEYSEWPPRPTRSLVDPMPALEAQAAAMLPDPECQSGRKIENVTRAVFSMYVPSQKQYDLFYISVCNATYVTQLTETGYSDEVFPRLSPDGTQVVFVSNQTGNDELYKINIDGSGLTQLTFDPAIDTHPAFSPDGTQIVFVSDRVRYNPEIFTMSSSGGPAKRITNFPGVDVEPDWSPDGKKIAWMHRDGQNADLYTMNPDGRESVKLNWFRYGGNPAWSMDSKSIAVEVDMYSTGWLVIDKVNAVDGTRYGCWICFDSGASHDMTLGSWYGSPGNEGIIFSKVEYLYQNGQWYITKGELKYRNKNFDTNYDIPQIMSALGYEFAFFPHAVSFDTTPPQVSFRPLPELSQAPFDVTVDIKDSIAGDYALQYKTDQDADWVDWQAEAYSPDQNGMYSKTFSFANEARSVTFRVSSAVDQGNNAMAENTGSQVSTRVYRYHAVARVQDARETPLNGALIDAGEKAHDQPVKTVGGAAHLYYTNPQPEDLTATIAKTGLGGLSPSWPVGSEDEFLAVLPPVNNRITNGYFENALTGWQTSGTPLPEIAPGRYGGSGVHVGTVCNGDLCLSDPEEFGWPLWGNHSMVVDSQGRVHFLGGTAYFMRKPGGGWELKGGLDEKYEFIGYDKIKVMSDGTPFTLIWDETLVFAYFSASGDTVFETIADDYSYPSAAADASGQVHVIYNDSQNESMYYRKRLANGQWQDPVRIGDAVQNYPRLAVGPDGVVHIAVIVRSSWIDQNDRIAYLRVNTDGSASPVEYLADYYGSVVSYPQLAGMFIDASGTLRLVMHSNEDKKLFFWTRAPSAGWSAARVESYPQDTTDELHFGQANLAPDGVIHIFLAQVNEGTTSGIYNLVVKPGLSGYQLNLIQFPGESAFYYAYTADSYGLFHFIWAADAYSTPRYQGQLGLSEPSQSTLSQTVTLPTDWNAPTLSFFYRQGAKYLPPVKALSVLVTPQGGSPVTLFEAEATASDGTWRHIWKDMSPWKGKTVTLTFQVNLPAGAVAAFDLDEITLGAWTTPIVDAVAPTRVEYPVGAGEWVELTGANLMDGLKVYIGDTAAPEVQWISDTSARFRVPPGLAMGMYPVFVENPGGVTAQARQPLTIGHIVFLPRLGK